MSSLTQQVRKRYLKARRDHEMELLKQEDKKIAKKKSVNHDKIKAVPLEVPKNSLGNVCGHCKRTFKAKSGFLSHERSGKCKGK